MVLVTTVMWSVILAVTFEFARVFKAYDYRTFFQKLLGPFWIAFEIIYFILLFIVLAVIGVSMITASAIPFGHQYPSTLSRHGRRLRGSAITMPAARPGQCRKRLSPGSTTPIWARRSVPLKVTRLNGRGQSSLR